MLLLPGLHPSSDATSCVFSYGVMIIPGQALMTKYGMQFSRLSVPDPDDDHRQAIAMAGCRRDTPVSNKRLWCVTISFL